jgi:hypothetical protein
MSIVTGMKKNTKNILRITALLVVVFAAIAYSVPLDTKDYRAFCSLPNKEVQTRYNLFDRDAYDQAMIEYTPPGSETKNCAVVAEFKIKLHVL